MEENALLRHEAVEEVDLSGPVPPTNQAAIDYDPSAFILPSTQAFFPAPHPLSRSATDIPSAQSARPFAPFTAAGRQPRADLQRTPKGRKRRTPDLTTPRPAGKAAITGYFSPTPTEPDSRERLRETKREVVDLLSSSPSKTPAPFAQEQGIKVTPPLRRLFVRDEAPVVPDMNRDDLGIEPVTMRKLVVASDEIETLDLALPSTVTKRRRKGPLRRWETAPVSSDAVDLGFNDDPMAHLARHDDFTIYEFNEARAGVTVVDLESIASLPTPPAEDPPDAGTERCAEDDDGSDDELPDLFPPSQRPAPVSAPVHGWAIRRSPRLRPPSRTHSQAPLASSESALPGALDVTERHTITAGFQQAKQIRAKTRLILRESVPGAWKEVEAEMLDLSGPAAANGRARRTGRTWRESGVEILDLTSP
ncbi:hypothetical protein LTR95_007483 [Oleoguttula sp. CCFEE 5521]